MAKLHLPYRKEDENSPKTLTFWSRAICHGVGGLLLGAIGIVFYGVFVMILMKESLERKEITQKEQFDVLSWSIGACLGNLVFVYFIQCILVLVC